MKNILNEESRLTTKHTELQTQRGIVLKWHERVSERHRKTVRNKHCNYILFKGSVSNAILQTPPGSPSTRTVPTYMHVRNWGRITEDVTFLMDSLGVLRE